MWEVPAGDVSVAEAQDALSDNGLDGLTIQTLTSDDEVLPARRGRAASTTPRQVQDVTQELAEITGSDIEDVSLNAVGPSWGEEISRKALRALVVFLVLITIYITLRFELRMAIPTLVALIHDVLITMGVYSIVGLRGHPGDGDRGAHDPRLLDLRRHRRVRQGRREHQAGGHHPRPHLQRHGRPLAEPGAHAVAEHLDHRAAAGGLAADPRLVHPRGHHAAGVRAGAADRPLRRRLLVALHRLAAARGAQGARAEVPRHPAPARGQGAGRARARRPSARRATRATTTSRPLPRRRRRSPGVRSRPGRARRARSGERRRRSLVRW